MFSRITYVVYSMKCKFSIFLIILPHTKTFPVLWVCLKTFTIHAHDRPNPEQQSVDHIELFCAGIEPKTLHGTQLPSQRTNCKINCVPLIDIKFKNRPDPEQQSVYHTESCSMRESNLWHIAWPPVAQHPNQLCSQLCSFNRHKI